MSFKVKAGYRVAAAHLSWAHLCPSLGMLTYVTLLVCVCRRLEELMNRPYATREESYAELAASPVLQQLRGHPKVKAILLCFVWHAKIERSPRKTSWVCWLWF